MQRSLFYTSARGGHDPGQLAWPVKEFGRLRDAGGGHDPGQLAWPVKEFGRLRDAGATTMSAVYPVSAARPPAAAWRRTQGSGERQRFAGAV